ncbi:hypothetical protein RRG08_013381 [Elysia crispata]|uniref:Uncharacterized protein n=1 Tax=Elysia crispata TaxID=231223 RepID=A0AAE0YDJ0_9GAST|nr:hypothetical protein RRG08_013381 [Elysia crispata]
MLVVKRSLVLNGLFKALKAEVSFLNRDLQYHQHYSLELSVLTNLRIVTQRSCDLSQDELRAFQPKCRDTVQIMTDASQKGWGSQVSRDLVSESTRQVQVCREANMTPSSSNLRELSAVLLSLMAFLRIIRDKSVQVLIDNIMCGSLCEFSGRPLPASK